MRNGYIAISLNCWDFQNASNSILIYMMSALFVPNFSPLPVVQLISVVEIIVESQALPTKCVCEKVHRQHLLLRKSISAK